MENGSFLDELNSLTGKKYYERVDQQNEKDGVMPGRENIAEKNSLKGKTFVDEKQCKEKQFGEKN